MEIGRSEDIIPCHIVSDKPPVEDRHDSWVMLPRPVMDTTCWGGGGRDILKAPCHLMNSWCSVWSQRPFLINHYMKASGFMKKVTKRAALRSGVSCRAILLHRGDNITVPSLSARIE